MCMDTDTNVCTCNLRLKLCTVCDVVQRVDLRKNMLFGETSLVKQDSLYAMLIQGINFLDMYAQAVLSISSTLCVLSNTTWRR